MRAKKLLAPLLVILLITTVFAIRVNVPTSVAQGSTVQDATLKYKGVAYVSDQPDEYNSTASHASLDKLKGTGANYVSILVTQYMYNKTSNTIFADPTLTPTDTAVTDAIKDAHTRGMGVLLKPQLYCRDGQCLGSTDLSPSNPTVWFASYAKFINHYADIAQSNGVELFWVGGEFAKVDTSAFYTNWHTVINGVRSIYHGPITYGACYTTYSRIPFWNLVDYVGIDAYFPLSKAKSPSVADLISGWSHYTTWDGTHNWLHEIETWQVKVHKQVVFTEIGYRSINYAAKDPGNWKESGAYNANGQANCYEAALRVFANKPWFAGMFWWGWSPNPNAGGAGDTGYTPQHKPAQGVLTVHWLSRGTTTAINASNTTPAVDQPVTFTATLKSGTTPLSLKPVTIYHYLNGIKYIDTTTTTNTAGQITLTQTFRSAGQRTYYAKFAGADTYRTSTSSVVTINVGATKVTLTASDITPAVKQKVTFTAALKSGTTPLSYKSVTIYHYLNGIKYTDTTKTTNADGQITLTQTFGSKGVRTYYAKFASTTSYKGSTSSVVTITIH